MLNTKSHIPRVQKVLTITIASFSHRKIDTVGEHNYQFDKCSCDYYLHCSKL